MTQHIEAILDRLKSKAINAQTYQQADGTQYGSTHSLQAVPLSVIEAERAKLTMANSPQLEKLKGGGDE